MTDPAPPPADPGAPPPAASPAPPADPGAPPPADLLGRKPADPPPADPNAAPEWLSALPEAMRGDATLTRYKSVEELAKGHIEAHKVAKSKVTLPNAEDPDSFARFAAAVRPEAMDKYTIDVPEGHGTEFAEAMRPVFFEAGLLPQQVEPLVAAFNQHGKELKAALDQKGQDAIDALKAEMGAEEYARGEAAAVNMLNRLGIKPDFENNLARMIGGSETLRTLFALAEKTGELGRVHADDVGLALGSLKGEAAMDAARAMFKDPAVAAKLTDPNSPERKKYDNLVKASARKD